MAKKVKTERKVESIVKPYELMLILSPELRETEITKKLKEITDMIEKAGGKITSEDFWGKKELAYRVQKHNEGVYMVYNIELPNQFILELKAHLRIEKEVLRSMLISLPANYTYVKYDIENMKDEKPKKEKEDSKKNVSIKHNAPIIQPKKKVEEEKAEEEKEEEKSEEKSEEKVDKKTSDKERDSELDKKLDEILGGEDLKL